MGKKFLFVTAAVLSGPGSLLGWGAVGHQTVAWIAQDQLTAQARGEIQEILGRNDDLVSVSTWADTIVDRRPETAPWHYLNLDVRQPENEFDLSGSCRNHDCVVDQILKDLGILRMPFAPRWEKREALKFLVHFVGDLHQPLHCVDDHDRGGNEKWFRYRPRGPFGRYTWINLHSFWDHLLETHTKENPARLAKKLENEIGQDEENDWARGKPADWAYESFLIAQGDIYSELPRGPVPKGRWGKDLPKDYYSGKMRRIVERQLEKAGIRLAFLLNGLFDH